MKRFVAHVAMAVMVFAVAGAVYGQDYYGAYPGQDQGYGSYGQPEAGYGYGQYGQGAPNYAQSYAQQAYGQQYGGAYGNPNAAGQQGYGQQYGNPYAAGQQGYGQQYAAPQQGYGQPGYDGYQGYQGYDGYGYGQNPGYPGSGQNAASYGNSQQRGASARRVPSRARQTIEAPQPVSPQISTSTSAARPASRIVEPSRSQASDAEVAGRSEIYWDGRYSEDDNDAQSSVQAVPVQQPASPRAELSPGRPAARPTSSVQERTKRARTNVVRQQPATTTAAAPPPPSRQGMKWGQEEKSETRRPMKWGQEEKPSIVGSEPGSFQGARTQHQAPAVSSSQAQADSPDQTRKFQWGKTQ